jgi:hypothetical protein
MLVFPNQVFCPLRAAKWCFIFAYVKAATAENNQQKQRLNPYMVLRAKTR